MIVEDVVADEHHVPLCGNLASFWYSYLLHVAILVLIVEVLWLIETADHLVAPELSDRLTYDGIGNCGCLENQSARS